VNYWIFSKQTLGEEMSRRRKAEKREIDADPVYGSEVVTKFVNKVMLDGKKSVARRIVYRAMESLAQKVNSEDPLATFLQALENAKPTLEVKSRRIGGATYQVPIEVAPNRRTAMAMRWVINHSRAKAGRAMEEGLAQELADCYNNQGTTIKKKDETHRMAEANKAFAHYRF
jgi:small subunit ribosomal protein S7